MSSSAELHLTYKLANEPFRPFPYPHFFIREAFPADFYARMQAMLPDPKALLTLEQARNVKGYEERFVLSFKEEQLAALTAEQRAFWSELHEWLMGGGFARLVLGKFAPYVNQRFPDRSGISFYNEALLVQDTTNYKLGPHTDSPRKVITLLFYLPKDLSQRHLGTSMYVPKDREFRCSGVAHYGHEAFDRVWTAPFEPNSLLAFFKTDFSFHGVEPVKDPDCRRWLLLYDIYHKA